MPEPPEPPVKPGPALSVTLSRANVREILGSVADPAPDPRGLPIAIEILKFAPGTDPGPTPPLASQRITPAGQFRFDVASLALAVGTSITVRAQPKGEPGRIASTSARLTEAPPDGGTTLWVNGYYPAWTPANMTAAQDLPASYDLTAFSHVTDFAALPGDDGSLDMSMNGEMSEERSAALIGAVHAAGGKVTLALGGANSAERFRTMFVTPRREKFVNAVVEMVARRGYDGVDIDMEPMVDADDAPFEQFVRELRARLRAQTPGVLLTAATQWQAPLFKRLEDQFDQINVMTYDLSGKWPGFDSWHNSALKSGDKPFASGEQPPSVESTMKSFTDAGIARSKLGIGIDSYAYVWSSVSGPNRNVDALADSDVDSTKTYAEVMELLFTPERRRFDPSTWSVHLSVPADSSGPERFVSYEDEVTTAAKIDWVIREGYGGVILWNIKACYRMKQPAGERDPIVQALKKARRGSGK